MTADVLIVGGGLIGSSTALHLAMRGARVTVLEKDQPGRHASGVNAGGLRQLNRDPAEIPLSVAAAKIWADIRGLVDDDCDVRLTGQLRVAENQADLALLEARAAKVRELGYRHERMIGRQRLYELVPALAGHCVGALYSEQDGYARPYHALTAFRRKAQSLGVEYRSGTRVTAIDAGYGGQGGHGYWQAATTAGPFHAPVLVNCAGAWADALCAQAGEAVPLKAGAPMMMVSERLPHFIDPVVGAASRKLSFKQMQNGTVVIGGAHLAACDLQAETTTIDFRKLAQSARTVTELFPIMANAHLVRCWAGLEAFTPDQLPVIGPSSTADGLFHAFGFSAHGFQLSPIVGRVVAELILDGGSEMPIDAFAIDRFRRPR